MTISQSNGLLCTEVYVLDKKNNAIKIQELINSIYDKVDYKDEF